MAAPTLSRTILIQLRKGHGAGPRAFFGELGGTARGVGGGVRVVDRGLVGHADPPRSPIWQELEWPESAKAHEKVCESWCKAVPTTEIFAISDDDIGESEEQERRVDSIYSMYSLFSMTAMRSWGSVSDMGSLRLRRAVSE